MGYILYTPTETADTFSQKTFGSLAELAKWAVAQALEAPIPTVASATVIPEVAPAPVIPIYPEVSSVTLTPDVSAPTADVSAAAVDMAGWFSEESESPWKKVLTEKNWVGAACLFRNLIEKCYSCNFDTPEPTFMSMLHGPTSTHAIKSTPFEVIDILYSLCKKEPVHVIERLGGCAEVQWDKLPAEFWKACDAEYSRAIAPFAASPKALTNPFLKDIDAIYTFFHDMTINDKWNKAALEVDDILWENTQKLTEYLVGEWVAGRPASDEIMQFFIKLVVAGRYAPTEESERTVGASEFMDEYQRMVSGLTGHLSGEFVGWATKRVQHRHCKAALAELGIRQVRRSEGQRYIGLKLLDEGGMIHNRTYTSTSNLEPYDDSGLAPIEFEPTVKKAPEYFIRRKPNTAASQTSSDTPSNKGELVDVVDLTNSTDSYLTKLFGATVSKGHFVKK